MLYFLVRPIARYVLRYYFRHIDISGLEHLPATGPVILAANHPTAFIEPCVLACFQRRPLWFLARGNLYKNRLATWTLRALHILPVFRIEDGGYGKLKRNFATFAACERALSNGRALLILAEGRCIHERKLRPLRKGTARIALGALEADPTLAEVPIVPVGVHFTDATSVRSAVYVKCGPPVPTSDFLTTYRANEARGVRELTAAVRRSLAPLVVQLPEPEHATETLLRIAAAVDDGTAVGITHSGKPADRVLSASRVEVGEKLLTEYNSLLDYLGATPITIQDELAANRTSAPTFLSLLLAGTLLLPHLPVWFLAQFVARTQTNFIEFYSPVRFAALAVATVLYLPLLFFLPWGAKLYLIAALLTVRWSLRQLDAYRRAVALRHYRRRVAHRRARAEDLHRQLADQLHLE